MIYKLFVMKCVVLLFFPFLVLVLRKPKRAAGLSFPLASFFRVSFFYYYDKRPRQSSESGSESRRENLYILIDAERPFLCKTARILGLLGEAHSYIRSFASWRNNVRLRLALYP
jgi:hypothetical protein